MSHLLYIVIAAHVVFLTYIAIQRPMIMLAYCAFAVCFNFLLVVLLFNDFSKFGMLGRSIERFKYKHLIEKSK
jgi:hypothetical protein